MEIRNWTARPSGGAITVYGDGADGKRVILRHVKGIEMQPRRFRRPLIIAVDAMGFRLATLV